MGRLEAYWRAIDLLKDENLVWSSDFETIRIELGKFLEQAVALGWDHNASLNKIVNSLIAEGEENATR